MNPTHTGRATVWLHKYQLRSARNEAEAIHLATSMALRDVPEATVKVMSTRRTPTGRWTVTVKRDRSEAEA
jgi:hypothetical protein